MVDALPAYVQGQLTVDLNAVVKNWRALDALTPNTLTAAVVKADAYGLGLAPVAAALAEAGAQFFFVATLEEGLNLRKALPKAHIFVLNGLHPRMAELYTVNRLMPVLSSLEMVQEWLEYCRATNEAHAAALHFDTGMNRLGIRSQEAELVSAQMAELGYAPQMVMSHLACADQPSHEKNRAQLALFQAVMHYFPNIPACLANSAGTMLGRDFHFQMVRPGIALYGGRAVNGRKNPMAPAVKLEIPILQVREAKTGETVGYGATYTIARDSRLAILAIGYADGLLRSLSSSNARQGGRVVYKGRILPIVGRVSMDLVAVDVTELGPDALKPGDMMEIFGKTITVDNQADLCGTIGYELLTSLKGRYQRAYISPAG